MGSERHKGMNWEEGEAVRLPPTPSWSVWKSCWAAWFEGEACALRLGFTDLCHKSCKKKKKKVLLLTYKMLSIVRWSPAVPAVWASAARGLSSAKASHMKAKSFILS